MLKFTYKLTARRLPKAEGLGSGPQGRISKMRKLVTALVRHERIEGKYQWLDEARGYAERVHKHIVLYCIVLYCIVLYCIVLYCIVLYCIVLSIKLDQPNDMNDLIKVRFI